MKQLVTIIFSITYGICAFGQVEQPKRYEITLNGYEEGYNVLLAEEHGVIIYKEKVTYNRSGDKLWEYIMLDRDLKQVWKKEYFIENGLVYRGYDYYDGAFYFLYEITRKSSKDLKLIKMDSHSGDTVHYRIKNLVPLELAEFEVTASAAIIGGYYSIEPVVIHYDFEKGKTIVLPGIFGNKTELVQLKINDDDSYHIIVSDKTYDKRNTLSVKTYDSSGNYIDNITYEPDPDKGLIFGHAVDFGESPNLLVSGTYGAKRSDFSRGIFIANRVGSDKPQIQYYNFADFDNFFNYMKAKRQKRVANKISRKKIKGKKIKFNYRIIVHDILKDGDNYIMLGEAFYPKYSNTSPFGVGGYHHVSSREYVPSNFAGYQYTHAVVIGFDSKGNMLWDNSFEIEDVISYSLEQFVNAEITDEGVVLLYLYDNEIRSKIIKGSEVVEGKLFNDIALTFEDDAVNDNNSSQIGGLEQWYDNNFIAYGTQKIKNLRGKGIKLNRWVFYLNKVVYK